MTMKIKELPDNEETFGSRLKAAREAARYTRTALAAETNIPLKSLEKYEYGTMSPDVVRLRNIASILGVSISYLIDGNAEEPEVKIAEITQSEEYTELIKTLNALDDARESGFAKLWRTAPKLLEKVTELLSIVNLDDILDIAERRELFVISDEQLSKILMTGFEEQEHPTDEIIARIIDTAVFGIDLYCIHEKSLSQLASTFELEPDAGIIFGSWSGHPALINSLRQICRELALKGKSPNFLNEEQFRKREIP